MGPWVITEYKTDELMIMRRNPYYWKVDTEGHQLPYIDGFDTTVVTDDAVSQAVLLNSIAGKLDFTAVNPHAR